MLVRLQTLGVSGPDARLLLQVAVDSFGES